MFTPARPRLPLLLVMALSLAVAPMSVLAAPSAATPTASFKGGDFERKISVSITNLPLREAIRLVGQKGRISLVIEDDIKETVNVDFKDVRLGDALETLFAIGGLQAYWNGNVFAVTSRKKALERGLLASNVRLFELKHAGAAKVAEFLNSSTLTTPYVGLTTNNNSQNFQQIQLAKADPRSNTVLVMGSASELALAERIVQALDRPQAQRIFKLSHAHATHVASLLNASLFNNGNKAADSASLQIDLEAVREGTGAETTSSGVEIGSSQTQIRTRTLQSQSMPIEARQSIAIPDTRTNSVIVMGSPETLAAAEALIPQLDRKLAQVAIDVEVVEVASRDALDLGVTAGGQMNSVTSTFDPVTANNPGWSIGYDSTTFLPTTWKAKLNALVQDRRAKVLARPTIIASDNTESQINIVDEVIKGTRLSNSSVNLGNGQNLVVVEPIYGVAGVTLNILPKVGADGTVTLRLHPTVSTIRETQKDSMGNVLSLLSRRELIAQQVTVESGKTLSLAGLTQNTRISTRNKFPILGDIPLLGWLFSSTNSEDRQTELVIMMTPRILPD
jgi:type II secretory pathway component GspD/PulD (secretin)